MNKAVVSACIVTHNNETQIIPVIDSIVEHTKGVDLKLFIVDNASSDNTVKVIKERFGNISIVELDQNIGFGAAHNTILGQLDSSYHAIVNPDILIDHDVLTEMAEYLDCHTDIGLLSPKVLNLDGSIQHLGKKNPRLKYIIANRTNLSLLKSIKNEYTMQDVDLSGTVEIENATGCFIFLRTELFQVLKGFDESFFLYFEDADLTRRMNQLSKCCYFPSVYVYHAWKRHSGKNMKSLLIHIQSAIIYLSKWKSVPVGKDNTVSMKGTE